MRACLILCTEEDKKALCQMLGKLHMPEEVDDDKVRVLKLLVMNLRSVSLLSFGRLSYATWD